MKAPVIVGMLLIALGAMGLAYGGISYWHREKVLDLGPIQATADKKETIPIPPIAGGLLLAGGVALIVFTRKG